MAGTSCLYPVKAHCGHKSSLVCQILLSWPQGTAALAENEAEYVVWGEGSPLKILCMGSPDSEKQSVPERGGLKCMTLKDFETQD